MSSFYSFGYDKNYYSHPSVSSHLQSQPTLDKKHLKNKCYLVADLYYVGRPTMVRSALKM